MSEEIKKVQVSTELEGQPVYGGIIEWIDVHSDVIPGLISPSGLPIIGFSKNSGSKSELIANVNGEELFLSVEGIEEHTLTVGKEKKPFHEIFITLRGTALGQLKKNYPESFTQDKLRGESFLSVANVQGLRLKEGLLVIKRFLGDSLGPNKAGETAIDLTTGTILTSKESYKTLEIVRKVIEEGNRHLKIYEQDGKTTVLSGDSVILRTDTLSESLRITINRTWKEAGQKGFMFYTVYGELIVVENKSSQVHSSLPNDKTIYQASGE